MSDDTPAWMRPGSLGLALWERHTSALRPAALPSCMASRDHLSDIGARHSGFTAALWARAARPSEDGSALPEAPRPVVAARRLPPRAGAAALAARGSGDEEAAVDGPEPARATAAKQSATATAAARAAGAAVPVATAPARAVTAAQARSPGSFASRSAAVLSPRSILASASASVSATATASPSPWPSSPTSMSAVPLRALSSLPASADQRPIAGMATVPDGRAHVGGPPSAGVALPFIPLALGIARRTDSEPRPTTVPPIGTLEPGMAPLAPHGVDRVPIAERPGALRRADPRLVSPVARAAAASLRLGESDAAPSLMEAHPFGVRRPAEAAVPGPVVGMAANAAPMAGMAPAIGVSGTTETHESSRSTPTPTPSAGPRPTVSSPGEAAFKAPPGLSTAALLPNVVDVGRRREPVPVRPEPPIRSPRLDDTTVLAGIAARTQACDPAARFQQQAFPSSAELVRAAPEARVSIDAVRRLPASMPVSVPASAPGHLKPSLIPGHPASTGRGGSVLLTHDPSPSESPASEGSPSASPVVMERVRTARPLPAVPARATASLFDVTPVVPRRSAQRAVVAEMWPAQKADTTAAGLPVPDPTFCVQAGAFVATQAASARPHLAAGPAGGGTSARIADGAAAQARTAGSATPDAHTTAALSAASTSFPGLPSVQTVSAASTSLLATATPTTPKTMSGSVTASRLAAPPGAWSARSAGARGEASAVRARAAARMESEGATGFVRRAPHPSAALSAAAEHAGAAPEPQRVQLTQELTPTSPRGVGNAAPEQTVSGPVRAAAPIWPPAPLLVDSTGSGAGVGGAGRHMSAVTPALAAAAMPAIMRPFPSSGIGRRGLGLASVGDVAAGQSLSSVAAELAPLRTPAANTAGSPGLVVSRSVALAESLAGAAQADVALRPPSLQPSEGAAPPLPDIEALVERACARLLEGLAIEQERRGVPSWL